MASLRDVAELAAVAPSTVSRVVNNVPGVAPDTIAVVREAVVRLGYTPGRPGRPLRRAGSPPALRRSHRIALLAPWLPRAVMNAPVYMDVIHGVEASLAEADKVMVLRHLPPDTSLNSTLFSQKIDGVVLFGTGNHNPQLMRLLQGLPCVQIMGTIEAEGIGDHVSYANHRIGRIAAEYLLGRGHRRMAIILQTSKYPAFAERLAVFKTTVQDNGGFCSELADENILIEDEDVLRGSPGAMQALFDDLLSAPPESRPTGVFLTADILAPVFFNEMQRRGLTPGKDLDIVSCNNERPLLAHLHPRPATIDIHAERVGRKAVEQLLWRIEHPDEPRVTTALDPALVEGEAEEEGKGQRERVEGRTCGRPEKGKGKGSRDGGADRPRESLVASPK